MPGRDASNSAGFSSDTMNPVDSIVLISAAPLGHHQ
jgi:hypothetical protein